MSETTQLLSLSFLCFTWKRIPHTFIMSIFMSSRVSNRCNVALFVHFSVSKLDRSRTNKGYILPIQIDPCNRSDQSLGVLAFGCLLYGFCMSVVCLGEHGIFIRQHRCDRLSEFSMFAYGILSRKHTYIILTPLNPTFI